MKVFVQTVTFWAALISAVAAVIAARVGRQVNSAVNRVPKGEPPLVDKVTELAHHADKIDKVLEVTYRLEGVVAQLSERVTAIERRMR